MSMQRKKDHLAIWVSRNKNDEKLAIAGDITYLTILQRNGRILRMTGEFGAA